MSDALGGWKLLTAVVVGSAICLGAIYWACTKPLSDPPPPKSERELAEEAERARLLEGRRVLRGRLDKARTARTVAELAALLGGATCRETMRQKRPTLKSGARVTFASAPESEVVIPDHCFDAVNHDVLPGIGNDFPCASQPAIWRCDIRGLLEEAAR